MTFVDTKTYLQVDKIISDTKKRSIKYHQYFNSIQSTVFE